MKIFTGLIIIALIGAVVVFFTTAGTVTMLVSQKKLQHWMESDEKPLLLDVRTEAEFVAGHVPGAMNISHDLLAGRLSELGDDKTQSIVVYCRSGRRAGVAEDILRDAGFTNLMHLDGDMLGWVKSGLEVERAIKIAPVPVNS